MKTDPVNIFCFVSLIILLITAPVNSFAADEKISIIVNKNTNLITIPDPLYISAIENIDLNKPAGSSSDNKDDTSVNWHKVLGWSTLGMMTVTITSGFVIPDKGHCALAGITTGLAVATCADGIYEYGGLISFADGDWRYNTHAILGTLATIGFITSVTLADGEEHIATGIASGAAFTLALGVIYF